LQEKLEETTEIIRSRRTDIVMTERKWSKRQIIIQKTIDWATRTHSVSLCSPEMINRSCFSQQKKTFSQYWICIFLYFFIFSVFLNKLYSLDAEYIIYALILTPDKCGCFFPTCVLHVRFVLTYVIYYTCMILEHLSTVTNTLLVNCPWSINFLHAGYNTTGATSGARTAYHSGAPEFTPSF
jgi:hypothetical protein